MKLIADKKQINGPQVDGGFAVTFYVGEWQAAELARLPLMPDDDQIDLDVKVRDTEGFDFK